MMSTIAAITDTKVMEFVVDSGSRDKGLYPSPCKFRFPIEELNYPVSSVRLSGCAIPRSELNVSTHNSKIPFNVDDSVTSVKIIEKGHGYVPGTYISSDMNGYVNVSDPGIFKDGTLPVVNLVFNNSLLEEAVIVSQGSLLFNGRFTREVTSEDVGAEPGATPANITLVIQDNVLFDVLINDQGNGWMFGVDDFGTSSYDTNLLYQRAGERAIIEVTVGPGTTIDSVSIVNKGKGYVIGSYRNKIISGCSIVLKIPTSGAIVTRGLITATVGTIRVAELRPGQYTIDNTHDGLPGLCREVTRALQKASSRALFPYSVMNGNNPVTTGSCNVINSNPNATLSKKLVIRRGETVNTNGNGAFLELLFGTYSGNDSSIGLLGFGSNNTTLSADSVCNLTNEYTLYRSGYTLPDTNVDFEYQDLNVTGHTIFNLNDTPNYLAIRLNGHDSLQKFRSENVTLNGASYIVVFKTGIDNVYSDQLDSQFEKMDILGNDTIIIDPAQRMKHLEIEIRKPNGDLYGTTRDLVLTFELTSTLSNAINQ
jgi:hypothetical protein